MEKTQATIPALVAGKVAELRKLGYQNVTVSYNDTVAAMYADHPLAGWSVECDAWEASHLGGLGPYDDRWHTSPVFPSEREAIDWLPARRWDGIPLGKGDTEVRLRTLTTGF